MADQPAMPNEDKHAAIARLQREFEEARKAIEHAALLQINAARARALRDIQSAPSVEETQPQSRLASHASANKSLARAAESGTAWSEETASETPDVSSPLPDSLNEDLAGQLAALPVYEQRRDVLVSLSNSVRTIIAQLLEPELNRHAATLPQDSYEEKKALAKWVNAELRQFGLALRCDRTTHPCILVGNPGNRPDAGRFMLQYTDERGKLHHPVTSVILPKLELMLDDLTRGSYSEKGRDR